MHQARQFARRVTVATAAVAAGRRTTDPILIARASTILGGALYQVHRFEEAITAHEQARDMFQEMGDRRGKGIAWNNLGLVLREVRRFDEAIVAHQQAGDRLREVDDRNTESGR